MNIKYVKMSVYIMSVLIILAITALIIGMIKTSDGLGSSDDSKSPQQQATSYSSVIDLEKFGNITLTSPTGFTCDKPQFQGRLMLIYCKNPTTNAHQVISMDLYKGTILGTVSY